MIGPDRSVEDRREPGGQPSVADGGTLRWTRAVYRFPPLRNAVLAGVLTLVGVIFQFSGGGKVAQYVLFGTAIVLGGWFFTKEGLEVLRNERKVGIQILMLAAAAGSVVLNLFEEAAALVVLYSSAEAVEHLTYERTRSAIRDLLELIPKRAHLLADGVEKDIPVDELRVGDRFLVRPGESIPTDGIIRSGASALNQAPVTGESVPVDKGPGQEVFAGSINGTRALEIEATAQFQENTLQRIVRLVETAQSHKSQTQSLIERFSVIYSPAVLAAAALLTLIPGTITGEWNAWFLRSVTLIVAGAPCALVMSVPVAIAAAITHGGKEGILVKGGAQLERLGRVRTVAFDKTGTLTQGKLRVTDIVTLDGHSERNAIELAAGVEAQSEHPLARAIVDHAHSQGVEPGSIRSFEALIGFGARAIVDGQATWMASPAGLVNFTRAEIPAEALGLQAQGKTLAVLGRDDRPIALFALRDQLRPEARETITLLRSLGVVHIAMLTGDAEPTAKAIAADLGIDDVIAELKPDMKLQAIEGLRKRFGATAMVGDGINDAPALAAADVGIAFGTRGSAAAIEAADVALMADDLRKVSEAFRLGRRAARISLQNLIFSILVLAVLIPSAVGGALTVVAAVVAHEVSEMLAVANGVRAGRHPRSS